eukprot:CAMPEP_0117071688 /NCGR_PEP_ID=MMETSP0472-20121206/50414_1 /TAXON_ID=693140 ORGANISM="Tiarina fusus, Strain LIS" /NCGR_SAMPLE_ID=MMETSP0472 /ASSEMBLY_ACC=CAM_ASM_000603 /LENGTH=207 /DNA_ID=CAMNT_0004795399 /DNA_START=147 /DNA_END=767 /DNA_ORIENTATION=-
MINENDNFKNDVIGELKDGYLFIYTDGKVQNLLHTFDMVLCSVLPGKDSFTLFQPSGNIEFIPHRISVDIWANRLLQSAFYSQQIFLERAPPAFFDLAQEFNVTHEARVEFKFHSERNFQKLCNAVHRLDLIYIFEINSVVPISRLNVLFGTVIAEGDDEILIISEDIVVLQFQDKTERNEWMDEIGKLKKRLFDAGKLDVYLSERK